MIAHILPCILEFELLSLATFIAQHLRELLAVLRWRITSRRDK